MVATNGIETVLYEFWKDHDKMIMNEFVATSQLKSPTVWRVLNQAEKLGA